MRDVLESLAAGELSVEDAEAALAGYVTNEVGRFDAARETRRGIPEAILAAGKSPEEVAALATTALETTGHAIVTRTTQEHRTAIERAVADRPRRPELIVDERSSVVTLHEPDYSPPDLDATVGIVTAGTADGGPAGEAQTVLRELGVDVVRIDDVGVANLTRVIDRLEEIRSQDVVIVAAGREGALPTVVAGLVDVPVIGLPISTGYGHGGDGQAALAGLLQSCTVLSVVNIDAGYVAGCQAGLIARKFAELRTANN